MSQIIKRRLNENSYNLAFASLAKCNKQIQIENYQCSQKINNSYMLSSKVQRHFKQNQLPIYNGAKLGIEQSVLDSLSKIEQQKKMIPISPLCDIKYYKLKIQKRIEKLQLAHPKKEKTVKIQNNKNENFIQQQENEIVNEPIIRKNEIIKKSPFAVERFLKYNRIDVQGIKSKEINIFTNFEELNLPQSIYNIFNLKKFQKPMPIQAVTWPLLYDKHDVLGIAETGSGKTLAFLLPAIHKILRNPGCMLSKYPQVLIIAPTRELVNQTYQESIYYGKGHSIRSIALYGGVSKDAQVNLLNEGCEIVIATPGRLNDLLVGNEQSEEKKINFQKIEIVVVDEADRLLDMGFEPQLRHVMKFINHENAQISMFTATFPEEVQLLTKDFLKNPIKVIVGKKEITLNMNIMQKVELWKNSDKYCRLVEIFQQEIPRNEKTLIFCKTKVACEELKKSLQKENIFCEYIHGGMSQNQRMSTMKKLETGETYYLIATDVASRGLDLKDMNYVINYDFPTEINDYIHRIGRTGRAGQKGEAISFITEKNTNLIDDLIGVLQKTQQKINPSLLEIKKLINLSRRQKQKVGAFKTKFKSYFLSKSQNVN